MSGSPVERDGFVFTALVIAAMQRHDPDVIAMRAEVERLRTLNAALLRALPGGGE